MSVLASVCEWLFLSFFLAIFARTIEVINDILTIENEDLAFSVDFFPTSLLEFFIRIGTIGFTNRSMGCLLIYTRWTSYLAH